MKRKKESPVRYKSATEKMKACGHALFCDSLGEYKCDAIHRTIYSAETDCIGCKFHVRRAAGEEIRFCQCEFCMKQRWADVLDAKI